MDLLIWIGSALTLLGLLGIVWCGMQAAKARNEGLGDAALRDRLRKLVPVNMAGLGLSVIGLMCVILGIFLS